MQLNRFGVICGALAIALSLNGLASAQEETGSAVFKGSVLNSSGTAMVGVTVRLYREMGPVGSGSAGVGKSVDFIPAPRLLMKGTLVRTVTTDAKGKFEAKNLKEGDYTFRAGDPMSVGYKYGRFKLEAGKTVEQEIKLDPPAKR